MFDSSQLGNFLYEESKPTLIKNGKDKIKDTCRYCGAVYEYDPKQHILFGNGGPYVKCPYCNTVNPPVCMGESSKVKLFEGGRND